MVGCPFKSQLKKKKKSQVKCHPERLLMVTCLGLFAPSPHKNLLVHIRNAHFSPEDKYPLVKPAPGLLRGGLLFDLPWNPGSYFCKERVLAAFQDSKRLAEWEGRPAWGQPDCHFFQQSFRYRCCRQESCPPTNTVSFLASKTKKR